MKGHIVTDEKVVLFCKHACFSIQAAATTIVFLHLPAPLQPLCTPLVPFLTVYFLCTPGLQNTKRPLAPRLSLPQGWRQGAEPAFGFPHSRLFENMLDTARPG